MNDKTMKTKLNGLVLAGGKSTRMGTDKGELAYHGKPHREYLYELLEKFCDDVYLSVRSEQHQNLPDNLKTITDKDQYRGPLNGMISAHQEFPEVAWLVIATDLPLIDKSSIQQLIDQRNPKKIATAYATHQSGLPEPMFAIWEAKAFPKAIEYLESGTNTCPRKFLINSETELIFPSSDDILINANNKEEYELALKKLQKVES